jgi:hypothetical protein
VTGEIRVYIEGGGHRPETKADLRRGFSTFLHDLRERAKSKRIQWTIVTCGSRSSTFRDYRIALKQHPNAFNVLLVDAEGPVAAASPWEHLKNRQEDQWHNPGVEDKHCHLMVQTMEAWLIADREKLAEYYGKGFQESALPATTNVEEIDKDKIAKALTRATRETKKGEYHKTRHAPGILETIRPSELRRKGRAPFCDRLFRTLLAEME